MVDFLLKICSDIRSAMRIWSRPETVTDRDVVWFVCINTFFVGLAALLLAASESFITGADMAHMMTSHSVLAIPLSAGLLFKGAKGLQASLAMKSELLRLSATLTSRNLALEEVQTSLEHQANVDFLTGLGNRRSFQITLYNRHNNARVDGKPFWLCILDLDDFKPVNDRYGHDAGDLVLKTVARRLRQRLSSDHACLHRLGGDEFAVLFDTEIADDLNAAKKLMQDICEYLSKPVAYQGSQLVVAASGGLIEWDPDIRMTNMMRSADLALIRAKRTGKRCICVANAEDAETVAKTG